MSGHAIDPEGFTRYGGDCICGAVYTYAGIPEPGSFDPDCPVHWDATAHRAPTPGPEHPGDDRAGGERG